MSFDRDLMVKAASSIRSLERENKELREQLEGLKKQASSPLEGRFDLAREVVDLMVKKGHVHDPADVLKKLAELIEMDSDELKIQKEATLRSLSGFADIAFVGEKDSGGSSPERSFSTALMGG